ncbi:MAG TPA: bZIP transcription factor [Stellaceae bacterium]|jgi:hypothetical protein
MLGYSRTYDGPARQTRAEFYTDAERDGFASVKAGRDIFRDVDFVKIFIPGSGTILVERVNDGHVERWPELYAAFKAGKEAPLSGTPLSEWSLLKRAQIAELNYRNVRTIEDLADLSDLAVQNLGMGGQMLRLRAKAYLDDAEREAVATKLFTENDTLRLRISTLENQVEGLGQQLLQMTRAAEYQRQQPQMPTYVPALHDPVEMAKQLGNPGAMVGAPVSALDEFAALAPPRELRMPRVAGAAALGGEPPAPPVHELQEEAG